MALSQIRIGTWWVVLTLLGCASDGASDTGAKPESSTAAGDGRGGNTASGSGRGTGGASASDPQGSGGGSIQTGSSGKDPGDGTTGGEPIDMPTDKPGYDAGVDPILDAGPETVDAGRESVDAGPPPMTGPDLGTATLADADRAALIFDLLRAENYVENWFPMLQSNGEQRALLITPSHGSQVRVRQNAIAKGAIDAWVEKRMRFPLEMPNGSIIVKDMYGLDADTGRYAFSGGLVMAKIAALDSAQYEGKWFFVRISSSNVPSRGTTCVNCHNGRGAKKVWPPDPRVMNDPGGKPDALVPYDYLFIPFCFDIRNPECMAPP